ncbi:arcB [Acrasis kona]|uniref:ArcB n=1 Tax=Acrasis kona TaxID=1008807 RepID=A0AAW2Z5Q1_9EUKA
MATQYTGMRYAIKAMKSMKSMIKVRTVDDLPPSVLRPALNDEKAREQLKKILEGIKESGMVTDYQTIHSGISVDGLPEVNTLDTTSFMSEPDYLKRATNTKTPEKGTGVTARLEHSRQFGGLDPRLQNILKPFKTTEALKEHLSQLKVESKIADYLALLSDESAYLDACFEKEVDPLTEKAIKYRKNPSEFIQHQRFHRLLSDIVFYGLDAEEVNKLESISYTSIKEEVEYENFLQDPVDTVAKLAAQVGSIWSGTVTDENEAEVIAKFQRFENELYNSNNGILDAERIKHKPSHRAQRFRAFPTAYQSEEKLKYIDELSRVRILNPSEARIKFILLLRRKLADYTFDAKEQAEKKAHAKEIAEWVREYLSKMNQHKDQFDEIHDRYENDEFVKNETQIRSILRQEKMRTQKESEESEGSEQQVQDKQEFSKLVQLQKRNDEIFFERLENELESSPSDSEVVTPILSVVKNVQQFKYQLLDQHSEQLQKVMATNHASTILDHLEDRQSNATDLHKLNQQIMNQTQSKYSELLDQQQYKSMVSQLKKIITERTAMDQPRKYLCELYTKIQLIGTHFHVKQFDTMKQQNETTTTNSVAHEKARKLLDRLIVIARNHSRDHPDLPHETSYLNPETINRMISLISSDPLIMKQIKTAFLPKNYLKKQIVPPHKLYAVKNFACGPNYVNQTESRVRLTAKISDLKLNKVQTTRFKQIMLAAADGHKSKRFNVHDGSIYLKCRMFDTREANASYLKSTLVELKRLAMDDTIQLNAPIQKQPSTFDKIKERFSNLSDHDPDSEEALTKWIKLKKMGKFYVGADETYGFDYHWGGSAKQEGDAAVVAPEMSQVAVEEEALGEDEEYVTETIEEYLTDDEDNPEDYFSETDVDEMKA